MTDAEYADSLKGEIRVLEDKLNGERARRECLEAAIKAVYRASFEGDVFPSSVAGIMAAHGAGIVLEDRRKCPACNGHGITEACCGQYVSGGYWDPPECCGQMREDDCTECNCTGRAPSVEEAADELPF